MWICSDSELQHVGDFKWVAPFGRAIAPAIADIMIDSATSLHMQGLALMQALDFPESGGSDSCDGCYSEGYDSERDA